MRVGLVCLLLVSAVSFGAEENTDEAKVIYAALETIQAGRRDSDTWDLKGKPSEAEKVLMNAYVQAVLDRVPTPVPTFTEAALIPEEKK